MEGKKAPMFTLADRNGEKLALKDVESDFTVLFFYPKDNTPGCTIEAKGFSDSLNKFTKKNIQVIGISGGDAKTKDKFCKKHSLKVNLLSDTDFKVAKKYQAFGEKKFMGRTFKGIYRHTFVLDKNKKVIKVFDKVKPAEHSREVLEFISSIAA